MLSLVLSATGSEAHFRNRDEVEAAEAAVRSRPNDAEAWIARARLRLRWGDAAGALADLDRAVRLGVPHSRLAWERGCALLEVGRSAAAEEQLHTLLEQRPGHVEARVMRGRALASLGRAAEAAREFERAIELGAAPNPDLYLAHARALVDADGGDPARALRSLAEARDRLGLLVALEGYALDLEQRDGRFEAALRRIERLAAASPRQAGWLIRRAAILEQAGRPDEAARALRAALLEIERLPRHRRSTPATSRLESEARRTLERVTRASPGGHDR